MRFLALKLWLVSERPDPSIQVQQLFTQAGLTHPALVRRVQATVDYISHIPPICCGEKPMSASHVDAMAPKLARDGVYTFTKRTGAITASNAGFDVLLLTRDAGDTTKRVGIAVKVAAGDGDGSTWTVDDVMRERELFNLCQPLWSALGLASVVHVFCAAHDLHVPSPPVVEGDGAAAAGRATAVSAAMRQFHDTVARLRTDQPLASHEELRAALTRQVLVDQADATGHLVLGREQVMAVLSPTLAGHARLLLGEGEPPAALWSRVMADERAAAAAKADAAARGDAVA